MGDGTTRTELMTEPWTASENDTNRETPFFPSPTLSCTWGHHVPLFHAHGTGSMNPAYPGLMLKSTEAMGHPPGGAGPTTLTNVFCTQRAPASTHVLPTSTTTRSMPLGTPTSAAAASAQGAGAGAPAADRAAARSASTCLLAPAGTGTPHTPQWAWCRNVASTQQMHSTWRQEGRRTGAVTAGSLPDIFPDSGEGQAARA